MEKKKWVVLRMETKSREFQSRTLLAYHLVKNGYGVILTRDYGLKAKAFPKGLFLVNNIFKTNNHLLKKIKSNDNNIIVIDEEGLVYINEYQYLKRVPDENLEIVSKFLCFGKEQYSIVSNKHPQYIGKFVITGNPRINLLNNMFNLIDSRNVKEIKEKHSPFILIVSNFSMVNLFGTSEDIDDRYDQILKKYNKLKLIKNEQELLNFKKSFNHINSIFEEFLNLVDVLAEKYPEHKIIIRPHPSEEKKIWEKAANKHNNVEVAYEGVLTEWIKASDLVIQNSCTSAIESLYLNKNCISFRPFIDEEFDQPLPNKLSKNVRTIDEVLNVTQELFVHDNENVVKANYDSYKEMANDNISFSEKDNSVQEILKVINSETIKETYYSSMIFKTKMLLFKFDLLSGLKSAKRYMGTVLHYFLNILHLNNNKLFDFLDEKVRFFKNSKKYTKNKMQSLSVDEIESIMDDYNVIYNNNIPFDIQKLDNESFIVK